MSELSPPLNNDVVRPVSEAKVSPVTPPVSPAVRPRAAGSTVLAVIALLVALGSAVLVGWFFYIWQPQLAALQQQQQTLSNQQQTQTTLFQSKQLELQQEMQQQLVDVVANWDSKAQQQAEKNQLELNKLQLQLEQQSGNVKGWQLLEVEYFLRLAEQKLFLEQNVSGVAQVLDLADQRLKQMQDASLVAVREAISQDKHMLSELNTPDMHQLHLTLSNLRQQSQTLPLRQSERAMDNQSEEEVTDDAADWQANLQLYWGNFWRGLVQVRASLPEDGVSLTAEQQISVRNTLTQQLLLAELAAMQHNQAVYAAAIQQSADSLQRYFAATEPAVQLMADDLIALSALQVSLPLLAPLKSPQLFDAYRQGTAAAELAL
jgi:uroporphyrin-3 C-methyltransferase